jgi:hypothetical protein
VPVEVNSADHGAQSWSAVHQRQFDGCQQRGALAILDRTTVAAARLTRVLGQNSVAAQRDLDRTGQRRRLE